jgi:hypothetical protein
MYCLETGYDQFLSDPFVCTCDCVQWPRAARSSPLQLSLEQTTARLVLPAVSSYCQPADMKHQQKHAEGRPSCFSVAKRDWGRGRAGQGRAGFEIGAHEASFGNA